MPSQPAVGYKYGFVLLYFTNFNSKHNKKPGLSQRNNGLLNTVLKKFMGVYLIIIPLKTYGHTTEKYRAYVSTMAQFNSSTMTY